MSIKEDILDLSRQNKIGALTPWFDQQLDRQIRFPVGGAHFQTEDDIQDLANDLVGRLVRYREETTVSSVVLGMSGGVDSALTAALFKAADWRVIGVTMPINQQPVETERGIEACKALGIEHRHIDLSDLDYEVGKTLTLLDPALQATMPAGMQFEDRPIKIRLGNIRARLRMITLYNLAAMEGGLVASTDNFSELGAGFWTLHGDVGDLSPIQSLLKSWEVPLMAKLMGVPESTWRATPTDGLGISAGDEAQLGSSYLEWDLMVNAIGDILNTPNLQHSDSNVDHVRDELKMKDDDRALQVFNAVMTRMGGTWFKRMNPVNLQNKFHDRYSMLTNIDQRLFIPNSLIGNDEPATTAVA